MTLTSVKGKSMMTAIEALEQIKGLRAEGVSFTDIAKTLEANGYRAEKTGKPIGEQMVRFMFNKAAGKLSPSRQSGGAKRSPKTPTPIIEVSKGPAGDLLELVKLIANQETLSINARLEAVSNIIAKRPKEASTATSQQQN